MVLLLCVGLLLATPARADDDEEEAVDPAVARAKLKERLIKFYTEVNKEAIPKIDALLNKTPDPEKLNKRLKKK